MAPTTVFDHCSPATKDHWSLRDDSGWQQAHPTGVGWKPLRTCKQVSRRPDQTINQQTISLSACVTAQSSQVADSEGYIVFAAAFWYLPGCRRRTRQVSAEGAAGSDAGVDGGGERQGRLRTGSDGELRLGDIGPTLGVGTDAEEREGHGAVVCGCLESAVVADRAVRRCKLVGVGELWSYKQQQQRQQNECLDFESGSPEVPVVPSDSYFAASVVLVSDCTCYIQPLLYCRKNAST